MIGGILARLRLAVRNKPRIALSVLGLFCAVIVVQVLYPGDRALPFTKLNGVSVGGWQKMQIAETVYKTYSAKPARATILGQGRQQVTSTLNKSGIIPDSEKTVNKLVQYQWYHRVLPGSLFLKGLATNGRVYASYDKQLLQNFVAETTQKCYKAPKNASISIIGEKAGLNPAKNGQLCKSSLIDKTVKNAKIGPDGLAIDVKAEIIPPERSDDEVKEQLSGAQQVMDTSVKVTIAAREYGLPKKVVAKSIVFNEDAKTKNLVIDLSPEPISAYLVELQKPVYITPGVTVVRMVDGVEQSRTEGSNGRGLNTDKATRSIKKALLAKQDIVVPAEFVAIAPSVKYDRSYSANQNGLQAMVNDLARQGDIAIAVQRLNGPLASANGSKQYTAASTYKLFVAYSVLKRIEANQLSWADAAVSGRNVDQCFESMIVSSDNPCAEWLGAKLGWSSITSAMNSLGLTATTLSNPRTTANDLNTFLQKLEKGQSLGGTSRDKLLSAMRRQVYRAGVPTGVDVPVADKVGFLDGYLHDAAIVYVPGGTYTVVILSKGGSWSNLASVAREIHGQLNRM